MKVVGVIPARLGSSRFPAKLLHNIAGKPLLYWPVESALKAQSLNSVIVATDSPEIKESLKNHPIKVIMTDSDLPSGSDRVWQAVKNSSEDIIVNIQGDEVLLEPEHIDAAVKKLITQQNPLAVSTLACALNQKDIDNFDSVKLICDNKDCAIYFSRFPIPYSRINKKELNRDTSLQHIGLYAYTRKALQIFCQQAPTKIEKAESLEQLRLLYLGIKIYVQQVEKKMISIDSIKDVKEAENILLNKL